MPKRVIEVRIGGRDYRIRSDSNEKWLQGVGEFVDQTMTRIRERAETVDSLDVAVLTALNIARELIELREGGGAKADRIPIETVRVVDLTEVAEAALAHDGAGAP